MNQYLLHSQLSIANFLNQHMKDLSVEETAIWCHELQLSGYLPDWCSEPTEKYQDDYFPSSPW